MKIKTGDTVVVISGKDRGKKGKVIAVKDGRVLVDGVNKVLRHTKPSQKNPQGGIIEQEAPIHHSNVMFYDAKAGKGVRVGYKVLQDGTKVRVSKKTGEEI